MDSLTLHLPRVSCVGLPAAELLRRENAAHERAAAQAAALHPDDPAARSRAAYEIGEQCLWHIDFPVFFPKELASAELFRLVADLPELLLQMHGGQPLDFWDYGYLADVLREALTGELSGRVRQCLTRALAWLETTAPAETPAA